jgi:hypothetical protein
LVAEQSAAQKLETAVKRPEPPASKSDRQRGAADPFPLLSSSHFAILQLIDW